jgi:hypothetical protein
VTLDQALCLRTLAGPGGPEENDSHDAHGNRPIPAGQTVGYARDP